MTPMTLNDLPEWTTTGSQIERLIVDGEIVVCGPGASIMAVDEEPEMENMRCTVLSALFGTFVSRLTTQVAPTCSRVNFNSKKYVVGQQQRHFLAAIAGGFALTLGHSSEAPRNLLQNGITFRVPIRLMNMFEVANVARWKPNGGREYEAEYTFPARSVANVFRAHRVVSPA
jgi:hypothetical protein